MSLFKPVASGSFYTPPMGQYVGTFLRHEDGGMGKDFGDGKAPAPMVRWKWSLENMDGTPVIHNGEQAIVDALAPAQPTLKNKTGKFFQAHLKRGLKIGEDIDAAAAECVGKRVMLVFNDPEGGDNIKLTTVLPYNG